MKRVVLAIALGNLLGYCAWHFAWAGLPRLWALAGDTPGVGARLMLIALTAIVMASPPGLLAAAGAWLARRAHVWVGLACGLWSLTLLAAPPNAIPVLRQVRLVPTVLILLSCLLGGWLLDLRAQTQPALTAVKADAPPVHLSPGP